MVAGKVAGKTAPGDIETVPAAAWVKVPWVKAWVQAKVKAKLRPATRRSSTPVALDLAIVKLAYRGDIRRMRTLALRLLEECEAEAADPGLFDKLGELMRHPD